LEWSWTTGRRSWRGRVDLRPLQSGRHCYGRIANLGLWPPPSRLAERIKQAWTVVQEVWPEGHEVSRSDHRSSCSAWRRRQLSLPARAILYQLFRLGQLDLIDDVIHENSHHHLNLCCASRFSITGTATSRSSILLAVPASAQRYLQVTFIHGAMPFERLGHGHRGEVGRPMETRD
jgi:hypothetical protein